MSKERNKGEEFELRTRRLTFKRQSLFILSFLEIIKIAITSGGF
jgi:hypothetical protein